MNADLQSLKRGMFWKTISTGMNTLAGFLMSVVFARFLGKYVYGELVLVYTVVSLFVILSNFGLQKALERFIPLYIKRRDEERTSRFILTSIGLGVFFTTLSSAIMFFLANPIAVNIFHKPSLALYVRWGVLYLFTFSLFTNIVFSIYHGFQRWKEECLLNGAYLFSLFSAVFIALSIFNKGIVEVLKINALLCLIGVLAGMRYIARFIKSLKTPIRFEEFRSQMKETLYFSAPLLMSGLLFYFITRFDKFVMGMYRPTGELAQYYIAFVLGTGIIMLIRVSETVLTPYLAKLTGENDAILKSKFQTIFRLFLHLPITLSIFLYFFIDPFIRFSYGPNFEIAATAFKIYLVIIVLRSAMTPIGLYLINIYAKTFKIAKMNFINTAIHLIFYFLLIPQYGYKGALATAIISYTVIWVYLVLAVREIKRLIPYASLACAGIGIFIVSGIDFVARSYHIHNRLIFSVMLPLVYLLFTLSRRDIDLRKIKSAI